MQKQAGTGRKCLKPACFFAIGHSYNQFIVLHIRQVRSEMILLPCNQVGIT